MVGRLGIKQDPLGILRDYTGEKLILINEGNQEDLGEGSCRRKCVAHANFAPKPSSSPLSGRG